MKAQDPLMIIDGALEALQTLRAYLASAQAPAAHEKPLSVVPGVSDDEPAAVTRRRRPRRAPWSRTAKTGPGGGITWRVHQGLYTAVLTSQRDGSLPGTTTYRFEAVVRFHPPHDPRSAPQDIPKPSLKRRTTLDGTYSTQHEKALKLWCEAAMRGLCNGAE